MEKGRCLRSCPESLPYTKPGTGDSGRERKNIEEGTELIQFRVTGSEGTIGNYYALPGTKPETIGIKADDVVETLQVRVRTSTTALVSTHKKDMPYYKDGATKLEGGGTQIFSRDLKDNVDVIKRTPSGFN